MHTPRANKFRPVIAALLLAVCFGPRPERPAQQPLSYGLTEKAVSAARRMKFQPATIAGMPVSQYVILEYNFNIY